MASTDAGPVPVKNQAYRVTLPILDADGDLVTAATGLDSEVSKDGGTFTDCTNEATEIATASGMYFLDLTATEMNADTVAIIVKTTSSGAKTTPMILYPNKSGGLAVNVTAWAGSATATTNVALKTTLAKTTDITGFNDISAANVQTELGTYGALKPTVAARTLDVTTTGEAGIDWANIGAPTTTIALTNTTIGTATNLTNAPPNSAGITTLLSQLSGITSLKEWLGMIAGKQAGNTTARTEIRSSGAGSGTFDESTDSLEASKDNVGVAGVGLTNQPDPTGVTTLLTRIPATLFAGITSLAQWLGSMAGKQTPNATAQTEIRATGAGSGTYDATFDSNEALRDRGDAAWITGSGGDPWTTALPGAYASGTAGNILGNRLDTAVSTRASQSSVDTLSGYVDTEVAAIKAKTDQLTFTGGKVDANAAVLAADMTAIAKEILKVDWTTVSGEAAYSTLNALRMLRNAWTTSGGTLTVKKEDSVTTAWTRTLSTDPAAVPITGAS